MLQTCRCNCIKKIQDVSRYVNEWGCELDPEKSYATTKKLSSFEHGDSPTPVRALIEIGGLIISAGMDGKVVSYNRETKDKLRLDVDTGSIVRAAECTQPGSCLQPK